MVELTSEVVKKWTKDNGADIAGIASVERFEGAPPVISRMRPPESAKDER